MPRLRWQPVDAFTRNEDQLSALLGVWQSLNGARGDLILPSSLQMPGVEARSLASLSAANPILVTARDLQYSQNRNPYRPKFVIEADRIRVLLDFEEVAVLGLSAAAIQEYIDSRKPAIREVKQVSGQTIGLMYMAFGIKAARAVHHSLESLRDYGLDIPACVVGDQQLEGTTFIPWTGETPFDDTQRHRFQFRAGRIKPFLYGLTPFERTLYLDADTEILDNILPGFELLDQYEMAITEERLTLAQLYNKMLAGWEINMIERDATIHELGDSSLHFINSGVFFFRKTPAVEAAFSEWHTQWLRWQQWDEQLALMRALALHKPNYKTLGIQWNHPHREKAQIIFHDYGRGKVRSDAY